MLNDESIQRQRRRLDPGLRNNIHGSKFPVTVVNNTEWTRVHAARTNCTMRGISDLGCDHYQRQQCFIVYTRINYTTPIRLTRLILARNAQKIITVHILKHYGSRRSTPTHTIIHPRINADFAPRGVINLQSYKPYYTGCISRKTTNNRSRDLC